MFNLVNEGLPSLKELCTLVRGEDGAVNLGGEKLCILAPGKDGTVNVDAKEL